jgi:hypothetical protein
MSYEFLPGTPKMVAVSTDTASFFTEAARFQALIKKYQKRKRALIEQSNNLPQYHYYDPRLMLDIMNPDIAGTMKWLLEVQRAFKDNAFDCLSYKGFDIKNILCFHHDDHTLWRPGALYPLSMPHKMDYIEGNVDNRNFDLVKAHAILEKNPWVFNLEEIRIPSYNAEEDRDRALEFVVLLPQIVHDKIAKYLKPKNQYWTVEIKRHIVYKTYTKFDVLHLKPAYIGPH